MTQAKTSEVLVSDKVSSGLGVRGPYGSGEPLVVRSPWDGSEIATMRTTTLGEADEVMDRARAAFASWRWTPAWKRAEILERASHLIEDNAEQIARIIAAEGGKPLKDARAEAKRGASTFRWASEEAKRTAGEIIEMDADAAGEDRFGWTIREPRGVIVAISPFNFPLNLVAHKVAPALAAANVVVLKPASSTPITALRLAELLREAGLPGDVLQVVVGPGSTLGSKLVKDERANMVTFTGSPPVGRQLAQDAGMKMITLELGNNSATIVDEDANLDLAVAARGGRRVRQHGPGVHLGAARGRAREGLRRVHGQVGAAGAGAQGRRSPGRDDRRGHPHHAGRGGARQGVGGARPWSRAPPWRPAAWATTGACSRRCSPT